MKGLERPLTARKVMTESQGVVATLSPAKKISEGGSRTGFAFSLK